MARTFVSLRTHSVAGSHFIPHSVSVVVDLLVSESIDASFNQALLSESGCQECHTNNVFRGYNQTPENSKAHIRTFTHPLRLSCILVRPDFFVHLVFFPVRNSYLSSRIPSSRQNDK